jgi:hypothetical protein
MGEGDSLWSLIICDHQMEQFNMPSSLSNWKFLRCFASGETIRQRETSSHNSGGLDLMLASRPSVHPKNARDLTVSTLPQELKADTKDGLPTHPLQQISKKNFLGYCLSVEI